MAAAALVVLALLVAVALAAPWVTPQNPYDLGSLDILDSRQPPGAEASAGFTMILGSDGLGRDLYSAIVYGLRISLFVGVTSGVLALLIGMCAGLLAAYAGGRTEVPHHARGRSAALLPGDSRRPDAGRGARQGRRQDHPGPGHGAVGLLRPHGAGLGAGGEAQGVRRGGPRPRPQPRPHHAAPHPAQLPAAADRRRHRADRPRHRAGGDALLPRRGHAADGALARAC